MKTKLISCRGHEIREGRKNKIRRMLTNTLDKNYRVLINVSREKEGKSLKALKELEDSYESKPGWKVIVEGGF